MKKKIIIINGPNMNLMGSREKQIYGDLSYLKTNMKIFEYAESLDFQLCFFQSNHEGEIIDKLHASSRMDGIILNAAAFTHYSYAIRDAVAAISAKTIEVHMSNVYNREEFRHKSVIAPVCIGQITGFSINSYYLALEAFKNIFESEN